eukprot:5979401-Pleurochrysis_carterae.AAC.1
MGKKLVSATPLLRLLSAVLDRPRHFRAQKLAVHVHLRALFAPKVSSRANKFRARTSFALEQVSRAK